jgi:predicted dehydrogenase
MRLRLHFLPIIMLIFGVAQFGVASPDSPTVPAPPKPEDKIRIAIIGLDHDHVWSLLKDMQSEPNAELVAIAEANAALVDEAKPKAPPTAKFYLNYLKMLDEAKPAAVFVTTENDRHFEILRECAKRHIHYSTEKPMANSAKEAREMERLAKEAGIRLMVNYWNAWVAPTHAIFHRVQDGQIGPVQRIIVQYGHSGPKEIGVSESFANWLYDPDKNGGGAIMDFGCYGAQLALWLKGRPQSVFAVTQKLKTAQHNRVDDDATILLEYPDGTATIEASWDWPYSMGQVQAFGPKGSLLATPNDLFLRTPGPHPAPQPPQGERLELPPLPAQQSNPISYFVDCIRNNKPIQDLLSARLNVQVMEILDAARESVRTGRAQELH